MDKPIQDMNLRREMLHLATLCAFAIAQPLYATLVEEESFFLGYQLFPGETVLVTAFYSVVLPLLLILPLLLTQKYAPQWRSRYFSGVVFVLATLFFYPF